MISTAVRFATCAEADVDEACRVLHDDLIARYPVSRVGPVRWRWGERAEVAGVIGDVLREESSAAFVAWLATVPDELGPIVVLALVDVDGGDA